MRALRIESGKLRVAENIPIPHKENEALIRVLLMGICNTDLEIVRGYADFTGTLGHEFVGVVEESPDPTQVGLRVVGEISAGCGLCAHCSGGDPRHCPERTVLGIHKRDGAFAEYLSLPPQNLLAVPHGISEQEAVFTEPLAAACEIMEQVLIEPGKTVAVIGDGKLGQLIAQVMMTTGCSLLLIGKHPAKLNIARQAGIATSALNSVRTDNTARFDFVVEASGAPGGLDLALNLVKPRGTIILKSTFRGPVELDMARIVVNETRVIGSRCGRFGRALKMLAEKTVNVLPLISGQFLLSQGTLALDYASSPGILKVLMVPQG
jgi:threonine dehydrogenase-like Zn-dependent dehydrogenase